MALIKCIECGAEFSDRAEGCPKCGCPTKFSNSVASDKTESEFREDFDKNNIEEPRGNTLVNDDEPIEIKRKRQRNVIVFLILVVIVVFVFNMQSNEEKERAILTVQNSKANLFFTVEEQVHFWIEKDDEIHTIYGWEAQKVEGSTYFVAFKFDYDDNAYNGSVMYCYEVELKSGIVREISGDDNLNEKYQNLGYIE